MLLVTLCWVSCDGLASHPEGVMLLVASARDSISVQTFYISRLSRTYFSVTVYKLTVKQLRSR